MGLPSWNCTGLNYTELILLSLCYFTLLFRLFKAYVFFTLHSYRYDNRDGSHSHWSDDTILQDRASFEIAATGKAKLTIDNVQYDDHSVYKCRVDFKMAPTSISSITLKVIGKGFRFLFVMLKKNQKNLLFLLFSSSCNSHNFSGKKKTQLHCWQQWYHPKTRYVFGHSGQLYCRWVNTIY